MVFSEIAFNILKRNIFWISFIVWAKIQSEDSMGILGGKLPI